MNKALLYLGAASIAAMALFTACDDDDAEDAVTIKENYDALVASIAASPDINAADDDVKDEMKDNCADLQDDVDSDDLDDFCNDLEAAIDDEDQAGFDAAKQSFAAAEADIRTAIGEEVGEAVEDAEDDDPLEGGNPGDDDDDDDTNTDNPDDGLNEDDVENPTDEE
jgi:hypothetical protein